MYTMNLNTLDVGIPSMLCGMPWIISWVLFVVIVDLFYLIYLLY